MAVESATLISELNPLWPAGTDPRSELDDHQRMVKGVLQSDAAARSVNLADLADAPTARVNLGLGGAAVADIGPDADEVAAGDHTHSTYLEDAQNLADVPDKAVGRTNLELGDSATKDTGTGAGDVATGIHSHYGQNLIPASLATPDLSINADQATLAFRSEVVGVDEGNWSLRGWADGRFSIYLSNDDYTIHKEAIGCLRTGTVLNQVRVGGDFNINDSGKGILFDGAAEAGKVLMGDGVRFVPTSLPAATPTPIPTRQVFTSSGTWNRPVGCTSIYVIVVGSGGGGGNAVAGQLGGGGGGGGGTAMKTIDVTAIASVAVTIGVGGSVGAGGTDTTFGAHARGAGGEGGVSGAGGGDAGAGGEAIDGDVNMWGGSGGPAPGTDVAGSGGNSTHGGGAPGGRTNTANNGRDFGGGGRGKLQTFPAGSGANGLVLVEEYY